MQFHEMCMDKIHNHEVAGSIPAPATKEKSTSYRDVARFSFAVTLLLRKVYPMYCMIMSAICSSVLPSAEMTSW